MQFVYLYEQELEFLMAPIGFSNRGTDFRTHSIDTYFYEPRMARKRPSSRNRGSTVKSRRKTTGVQYVKPKTNSIGTQTSGATKTVVSRPTTNQETTRVQYYKKRVSRKKRRRAIKSYKSFLYKQFKAIGLSHQVFRTAEVIGSSINLQSMNIYIMKGANGDLEKEQHMYLSCSNVTNPVETTQSSFNQVYFQQSTMDIQMRNNSGSGEVAILDIYYFNCKKDLPVSELTGSPTQQLRNLLENISQLEEGDETGPTNLTYQTIGVTPFQCPRFCKYFTITRKEHVQLNNGQTMTQTLKSSKRHYLQRDHIKSLAAVKNVTTGMVIVCKGVYNGAEYPTTSMNYGVQWTYSCKRMDRSADTGNADPSVA